MLKKLIWVVFLLWLSVSCAAQVQRTKALVQEQSTVSGVTHIQLTNDYIDIRVDNSGLFTFWTVKGDPDNPQDDYRRLLYGSNPGTSFTTIRIDGSDYVFGEAGEMQASPHFDGESIVCSYRIGMVLVTQRLSFQTGYSTGRPDTARISYKLTNQDIYNPHSVGVRIMLDTMLGSNDGAPFRVPGTGALTTEKEFRGSSVPQYWQAFDYLNSPSIVSQGTLEGGGIIRPDRFVLAAWPSIVGTDWEYAVTTGRSLASDSAVAIYWGYNLVLPYELKPMTSGTSASKEFVSYYGIGGLTIGEPGQLGLAITGPSELQVENGCYCPDPFVVTAYVGNNTDIQRDIEVQLNLPSGLNIANNENRLKRFNAVPPHESIQASWFVTPRPTNTDTNLTYWVWAGSAGLSDQSEMRSIKIPAAKPGVVLHSPYQDNGHWYLAQTHCHWKDDTGKLGYGDNTQSVAWVQQKYRDKGYSFAFVTEHNIMEDSTSEEVTTASYAQDPTDSSKWIFKDGFHVIGLGMASVVSVPHNCWWSRQTGVTNILDVGGTAIVAHPNTLSFDHMNFESWTLDQLKSVRGYVAMEVLTASSRFKGIALNKWDDLLANGKRVWGVASDDYTPSIPAYFVFDGGCIRVNASSSSEADLLQNIRQGNFCASTGSNSPNIAVTVVDGNRIKAHTSVPCMIGFQKRGDSTPTWHYDYSYIEDKIIGISDASYECSGNEGYVRVTAIGTDQVTGTTYSQPVFVDCLRSKSQSISIYNGGLVLLGSASLTIPAQIGTYAQSVIESPDSQDMIIEARTVSIIDLPDNSPPWGFVGQPIELKSDAAEFNRPATLTMSFTDAEKGPINPQSLAIYRLDSIAGWNRMASTVDIVSKTVSCEVSSLGIFTVGAEIPNDVQKPQIEILQPSTGTTLQDKSTAMIATSDDNGVSEVELYLDDTLVGSDGSPEEGWSITFDASKLPNGVHRLIATSVDASGNRATASIPVNIAGGQVPTVIIIEHPSEALKVTKTVEVDGKWTGDGIRELTCLVDDCYVGQPVITGDRWVLTVAVDQFSAGFHVVKVLAATG